MSALGDLIGRELGPTEWLEVDQARIDSFAETTGDHQWIHVDPVRAADGPFGTTIAHGYLPGGEQGVVELTVEREGGDKPVCVAELVLRMYR